MKNMIVITTLAVMACSPALAATMASQPWVTNRIAEAEARTDAKIIAATNAIPAPGDYATVSNRAMSALQSHQPLTPATNYTDTAVSAMGSVLRDTIAESAQASTNYTDAVAAEFEDGTRTVANANGALVAWSADRASVADSLASGQGESKSYAEIMEGSTNAARAVAASKQDALPYPTNAIPYAAISGAPSGGGQEWRIVNYDVEVDAISFVTNGMANLIFLGGQIGGAVITNGWPDGASMFVRGQFSAETSYTLGSNVRLVGYGTWPTNNFQSVWWRSDTNIFVNILVEE